MPVNRAGSSTPPPAYYSSSEETGNERSSSSSNRRNTRRDERFDGFQGFGGFFRGASNFGSENPRFSSTPGDQHNFFSSGMPGSNARGGTYNFTSNRTYTSTSGSRHSTRAGSGATNDVEGDVENLTGTIMGSVRGNVGRLQGTVMGSVEGNIRELNGTVMGNVTGDITRLNGTIMGNVYGTIHHKSGVVMGRVFLRQQPSGSTRPNMDGFSGRSSGSSNNSRSGPGSGQYNQSYSNNRYTPHTTRPEPSSSTSVPETPLAAEDPHPEATTEIKRLNNLPQNATNHEIIGVGRFANQAEIKNAFRVRSRIIRPLVQQNTSLSRNVTEAQQRLNAAYSALINQGGDIG